MVHHAPQVRQRLINAGIPVVETWDMTPTPIDMLVGFSHEEVGAAVARHLFARGHRRFGLVWADDARALARQRGFVGELEQRGCREVQVATVPAPSTLALGRQGLATLLARKEKVDAVFCSSDLLAHGALEEARARGLAVPRDLAIIGFGGLEFAEHTSPALSTVRIDRTAIGRKAADLLLARIEGRVPAEPLVDVGFQIVDRQTT